MFIIFKLQNDHFLKIAFLYNCIETKKLLKLITHEETIITDFSLKSI